MGESRFAMAQRHVREGRPIVERQRQLVLGQQQRGYDTTASESLLRTFERTLDVFESDLAAINEQTTRL